MLKFLLRGPLKKSHSHHDGDGDDGECQLTLLDNFTTVPDLGMVLPKLPRKKRCGLCPQEPGRPYCDHECRVLLHYYTRHRYLGGGVYEVMENGEMFAAKMFKDWDGLDLLRERWVYVTLRACPGTVQYMGVVKEREGERCYGSLITRLYGPSLRDYWLENGRRLSEEKVAATLKKLATTLWRMHSLGVVHCDLNLENIFLEHEEASPSEVVIGDFGAASVNDQERENGRSSGTRMYTYVSPEMLAIQEGKGSSYTTAVDVWGLGTMACELLGGRIRRGLQSDPPGKLDLPDGVSMGARHLVEAMLAKDPSKRCTLDAVLRHPWVLQHTSSDVAAANATAVTESPSDRPDHREERASRPVHGEHEDRRHAVASRPDHKKDHRSSGAKRDDHKKHRQNGVKRGRGLKEQVAKKVKRLAHISVF